MSWDEAFATRYDEWAAAMTEDIAFYVELAPRGEGPLVELAVGSGRVAIPVARDTGRRVIGIDSSPAMLEQARDRAAEAGVELDLREGDMRDFSLGVPAALIYCPFRALLHLPSWADRRRTFERVAASLRPRGRFAWNAFAFDHRIAARLDGQHQDAPFPTRFVMQSATIASTSHSTTTGRARCGGQRRTSGRTRGRRGTGDRGAYGTASIASRSAMRAASTYSLRPSQLSLVKRHSRTLAHALGGREVAAGSPFGGLSRAVWTPTVSGIGSRIEG